jgi:hypothetical protein
MISSVEAFLIWAPTIFNQFIQLLERGEGSDLTLCQIITSEITDVGLIKLPIFVKLP